MKTIIWHDGKPIASDNVDEAKRLSDKVVLIDKILKEMGYSNGYEEYVFAVNDMTANDFPKYIEFLKKTDEQQKQNKVDN